MGFARTLQLWLREPTPTWADDLGSWRFARLVVLLESQLKRRGLRPRRTETTIWFDDRGKLVLSAVARAFREIPTSSWPHRAGETIDTALRASRAAAKREGISFEEAKPRLRVQLSSRLLEGPHRRLARGLHAVVVVDGEHATWAVTAEQVERWARDDIFDLALASSLELSPRAFEVCVKGEQRPAFVTLHGSPFTGAHVLRLRERVPEIPERGAFVCVPTHNTVLVRPLDDVSALEAANHMLSTVAKDYAASINRVSPSLFWWTDERIEAIDMSHDGDVTTLQPSDELGAVVKALTPAP